MLPLLNAEVCKVAEVEESMESSNGSAVSCRVDY